MAGDVAGDHYAGPTFHHSPAPAKLPPPPFLSRSVGRPGSSSLSMSHSQGLDASRGSGADASNDWGSQQGRDLRQDLFGSVSGSGQASSSMMGASGAGLGASGRGSQYEPSLQGSQYSQYQQQPASTANNESPLSFLFTAKQKDVSLRQLQAETRPPAPPQLQYDQARTNGFGSSQDQQPQQQQPHHYGYASIGHAPFDGARSSSGAFDGRYSQPLPSQYMHEPARQAFAQYPPPPMQYDGIFPPPHAPQHHAYGHAQGPWPTAAPPSHQNHGLWDPYASQHQYSGGNTHDQYSPQRQPQQHEYGQAQQQQPPRSNADADFLNGLFNMPQQQPSTFSRPDGAQDLAPGQGTAYGQDAFASYRRPEQQQQQQRYESFQQTAGTSRLHSPPSAAQRALDDNTDGLDLMQRLNLATQPAAATSVSSNADGVGRGPSIPSGAPPAPSIGATAIPSTASDTASAATSANRAEDKARPAWQPLMRPPAQSMIAIAAEEVAQRTTTAVTNAADEPRGSAASGRRDAPSSAAQAVHNSAVASARGASEGRQLILDADSPARRPKAGKKTLFDASPSTSDAGRDNTRNERRRGGRGESSAATGAGSGAREDGRRRGRRDKDVANASAGAGAAGAGTTGKEAAKGRRRDKREKKDKEKKEEVFQPRAILKRDPNATPAGSGSGSAVSALPAAGAAVEANRTASTSPVSVSSGNETSGRPSKQEIKKEPSASASLTESMTSDRADDKSHLASATVRDTDNSGSAGKVKTEGGATEPEQPTGVVGVMKNLEDGLKNLLNLS